MNQILKQMILSCALFSLSHLASAQTGATTASTATPNDAQIAHIAVTANQIDVDAGKMAEKTSKNKEVQKFAKQMVTDHSAVNQKAAALASKLKMTPEDNPTSQALKKEGDDSMNHLKTLKGKDFDKAYVDHEVAFHKEVLASMDKTLMPDAKNPELKDLLAKARPVIEEHLNHALRLQSSMSK